MAEYFWYGLRVRGGKEEKIKEAIEDGFADKPFKSALKSVYIPFQRKYDVRKGKREIKKSYVAYIFVEIDLAQEGVREYLMEMEGIFGFITPEGYSKYVIPMPLNQVEIDNMLGTLDSAEKAHNDLDDALKEGDQIEIIDGPFQGNKAIVQKADKHSKKIEVLVRIFQKETKLELNANQVKKSNLWQQP